jgi:hypothetical protein
LENGFVLSSIQEQTTAKRYQIGGEQRVIDIYAIVYDNGMVSIIFESVGENQNALVRSVLLAAYGSTVANWISPIIAGRDFSDTFEQNGTAGDFNINISVAGQVGFRTLNITIMPISQ